MATINITRIRQLLQQFDFAALFVEELGWDRHAAQLELPPIDDVVYSLRAVAEKRGLVVYVCRPPEGLPLPAYAIRRRIERLVARTVHEHLIIYIDHDRSVQVWQWVKREPGRPDACREHVYHRDQPGDALILKLERLAVSLDEEEAINLVDMAGRTRAAFNVERVTKRFYERFKTEHSAFLDFISGIPLPADRQWYASIMLNRLMFVYFIQKKGFLDNDPEYLRNRLRRVREEQGSGRFHTFFRYFLLRLFHEGMGKKKEERGAELDRLLGRVPFLNGGLFDVHELEVRYDHIDIPDDAFSRLFDFFEQYHWHLDERPLRKDNEINPDVLGYIFEKYINQKQMGAYYTKEDITEYIGKNTTIPYLFDAARKKCRIAFEGEQSVWRLLARDPDRYIYDAVRHGCDLDLPPAIAAGLDDVSRRTNWNTPAPATHGLPTEIWREVVARRRRYEEVRQKLAAGEIRSTDDLITYNLNIRQFAQDVIENCEGPELLRAFWHAIVGRIPQKSNDRPESGITILDPTCGSGAFLFAALNILEPLYEACLERMRAFVAELEQSAERHRPEKFGDFKKELERVAAHPNQGYFIMKSIILNNLYGVDIMAEAVEICKLRLFLKMVAQVERAEQIEPLPDIDFNIRCGNTLVGFATYEEVREAVKTSRGMALLPGMDGGRMAKIEQKAQDLQQAFDLFRRKQVEGDGSVPHADKEQVRQRLAALEAELNQALAAKYGIDPVKEQESYRQWLASHQPFHWFIEYYGIMTAGGFDVIIGNPPYVVYSEGSLGYKLPINQFRTFPAKNLYAFVFERSVALAKNSSPVSLIVQLTAISSERLPTLQDLLGQRGLLVAVPFPRRPESVFEGVEMPVVILLSLPGPVTAFVSTHINRFYTEERATAMELLSLVRHDVRLHGHRVAKLGTPEGINICAKIYKSGVVVDSFSAKSGEGVLYYQEACRYWLKAFAEIPFFTRNGKRMEPPHGRVIHFATKNATSLVACLLNSSLFYWFYSAFSDCEHVNDILLRTFRIPEGILTYDWEKMSCRLGRRLQDTASRKAIKTKQGPR